VRNLTKVVRWVATRTSASVSEKEVASDYLRFIEHAWNLVRADPKNPFEFDVGDVEAELRREFGFPRKAASERDPSTA
jgi:hypothetical protein